MKRLNILGYTILALSLNHVSKDHTILSDVIKKRIMDFRQWCFQEDTPT